MVVQKFRGSSAILASVFLLTAPQAPAQSVDPFAINNGTLPTAEEWSRPLRLLNADYPDQPVPDTWHNGGGMGLITLENAPEYVDKLKVHVEDTGRRLVLDPDAWNPVEEGWYGMIWTGHERDPILGSYGGQTLLKDAFEPYGATKDFTNHAIIYYNGTAAAMLGEIWQNPFQPDFGAIDFPEGSIIIKSLGAEIAPADFPVLEGAPIWNVFAQPFGSPDGTPPAVLETRVIQFDIVVKDSIAAPGTGWVFSTFIYDKDAEGDGWDRLVPLGAQWGNDPEFARTPDGGEGKLTETWRSPDAPAYSEVGIGWGGRLSGPMDLAERQNVVYTDGTRSPTQTAVSACLSCHSTGQAPFIANLYPAPNKAFPPAGSPFLMFPKGSAEWARWYENRDGTLPFTPVDGAVGTDYNMLLAFAINNFYSATGQVEKVAVKPDVH